MAPDRPIIIAHRGASSEAPENTLSAIRAALEMGADYIEIDVRCTKDNIPVVVHDSDLRRVGGIHFAPIHQLRLDQIKEVDVGAWFSPAYVGEQVPKLSELFLEEWRESGLMLEIKNSPQQVERAVALILEVLAQARHLPKKIAIGSFSPKIVEQVKRKASPLPTSWQLMGIVEQQRKIQPFVEMGVQRMAIWHRIAAKEFVSWLLERQIEVWVFTVDDLAHARELLSWGVSGIISNRARELIDLYHPRSRSV